MQNKVTEFVLMQIELTDGWSLLHRDHPKSDKDRQIHFSRHPPRLCLVVNPASLFFSEDRAEKDKNKVI